MCKLVVHGGHCHDNRNLANAAAKAERVLSAAVTTIKDVVADRETWLQRCRKAIQEFMRAWAHLAKRRAEERKARRDRDEERFQAIRDEQLREIFKGAVDRMGASTERRDGLSDELHEVELNIEMFTPAQDKPEPKEMALMHFEVAKAHADELESDACKLRAKMTKADWEKTPWTPRREKYEELRRREATCRVYEAGCRKTYENMPTLEELKQRREALVGELIEAEEQVKEDKQHRDRLSRTGRPRKDKEEAVTLPVAA